MTIIAAEYRKKGLCSKRKCTECFLYQLCGGCNNKECLIYHCTKGVKYTGITYPTSACQYREFCYGTIKFPITPLESQVKANVDGPLKLPKFIPIIKLTERESWFWSDVKISALVVKLEDILLNEEVLSKAKRQGLHDYLNYNGKIILSTIMPDELIDELEPKQYAQLIKQLRPDAYMIIDDYTYIDDPRLISWKQLFRMIERARQLIKYEPPGHPIGLIKGASTDQVEWSINAQLNMNIKTYALPCRGLYLQILKPFLTITAEKLGNKNYTVILYGKSYLYDIEFPIELMEVPRNFHYASMTWYIYAKKALAYLNGRLYELPSDYSYYCECKHCQARDPHDLARDKKALALHNLTQLIKHHKQGEQ